MDDVFSGGGCPRNRHGGHCRAADDDGDAAVDSRHAGVASGINNAVARVAGLVAIAVFGVVLAWTFDARVIPRLDHRLALAPAVEAAINRELPKMAGARLEDVSIQSPQRAAVRLAVDEDCVGFRLVMIGAAALTLGAAAFGAAIR